MAMFSESQIAKIERIMDSNANCFTHYGQYDLFRDRVLQELKEARSRKHVAKSVRASKKPTSR